MTTPTDPTDAVEQSALGPKRVQVGNESVEQHPLTEAMKAAEWLAANNAAAKKQFGLRFTKLIPPGGNA